MKYIYQLLISLLLFLAVESALGIDISQPATTSQFACFKEKGVKLAIVRGFRSYGALDPNAAQTLKNARSQGLTTDIYMFPCRGKTAQSQVDAMFSGIDHSLYNKVWLDIETNPSSGCSWKSFSPQSNCDYIGSLIKAIRAKGKNVGLYASLHMWTEIMGSKSSCTSFTSYPLWYAHYDNK